jgi:hypothetical protein
MASGTERAPWRTVLRFLLTSVVLAAVLVGPVVVANESLTGAPFAVLGAVAFIAMWVVVVKTAIGSLMRLYGRPRSRWEIVVMPGGVDPAGPEYIPPPPTDAPVEVQLETVASAASAGGVAFLGIDGAFSALMSYVLYVHGFAVSYLFLATRNAEAFSEQALSYVDCVYLSATTAMTVGFGDIAPVTSAARSTAIAQMGFNLLYVVGLFSAIAAVVGVRDGRTATSPR